MGLTLYCQKTKRSLDLSSGGFMRFRARVSDRCGEPWASHYRQLTDVRHGKTDEWFAHFDMRTQQLIDKGAAHFKIVDFLLQSDIKGAVRYGACQKILELIGDYDDNFCYGYAAMPNQPAFRDIKDLIRECVETKSDLRWR